MALLDRYIFKITLSAFIACLVALTGVIWITQALRELDLLTSKGQTIFIFFTVTGLSLPAMIMVISPVAAFIATLYALNRLNSDSELIVMSAAGVPPSRLIRPFLYAMVLVCAIVSVITLYVMPASFRELRDLVTKIRGDFIANIVKEGQFTTLDSGITFHYRERAGQALLGIFMQDRRDPEKTTIYVAERGQTMEADGSSYLVLEKGSVHRQQPNSRDSSIVTFDRYAIDLSSLSRDGVDPVYKPRERGTWELFTVDKSDPAYQVQEGRFRSELHDRLSAPLYPIAFILIAFAALGEARTTRQGRGAAIAAAIIAAAALRIAGYAASTAVVRNETMLIGVYAAPFLAIVGSLLVIFQGAKVRKWGTALVDRILDALPRFKFMNAQG